MSQDNEFPAEVLDEMERVLGTRDLVVSEAGTAHVPGLGDIQLIRAYPAGRHNEQHAVTVDADGVMRTRAELTALAGRDVFLPAFPHTGRVAPARLGPTAPVTIEPRTNDLVLNRCQTLTETITVTVPPSGVAPKADVYLLADTTGSMSGVLSAVAAAANAILSDPAFAPFDVAWGVGNYRDFPVDGVRNSYAFQHQLSPTTVVADAVTAIGTWAADEGSDIPEGQLFAFDRLANDPAIGWRPDAKRIVVWMGDAPGHDPICAALSGLGVDVTEASATAALVAGDITVVAIGTNSGVPDDLDGDPLSGEFDYSGSGCPPGGTSGQATRIAAATGGSYTSGLSAADVVAALVALIKTAITSIGNVRLVPVGGTAEFVASINPAGGYGPLPGDTEHVLTFDVTWRGTRACAEDIQEFAGALEVVADGAVVAAKPVRVTVPACRFHYPVTLLCGPLRSGDRCRTVEPGRYATLVTLYNPGSCPVVVEKRFAPIAINGDVVAREPKTSAAEPFARIKLEPGEVTIDDCCAVRKVSGGASSLIGILDLVASGALDVTVTTTVTGICDDRKHDDDGHDDRRDDDHDDDDHDDDDHGDGRDKDDDCCCTPSISSQTVTARMAP